MAVVFEREHFTQTTGFLERPISGPQQYSKLSSPLQRLEVGEWQNRLATHPLAVELQNMALETHIEAANGVPDYVLTEARGLNSEIAAMRRELNIPEARKIADQIAARFILADIQTIGKTPEEKARTRLEQADGIHGAMDVDGTLTVDPDSYLERLIPGSRPAEKMLKTHGREAFPLIFPLTWQHGLRTTPEDFRVGGLQAPLREGVNEFFQYAKDTDMTTSVVTANFDEFTSGILDQIDTAPENMDVWAISRDSIASTDKGAVVTTIAIKDPNKAVIYFGDGSSDLPALEAAPVVAVYFALKDSKFAKQLAELAEKGKVVYFEYETFYDVTKKLREITPKRNTRVN